MFQAFRAQPVSRSTKPLLPPQSVQCRHKGFKYILHNRAVGSTAPNSVPTLRQLLTHLNPKPVQKKLTPKRKRHRADTRTLGKGNYVDTHRYVGHAQYHEWFLENHKDPALENKKEE